MTNSGLVEVALFCGKLERLSLLNCCNITGMLGAGSISRICIDNLS